VHGSGMVTRLRPRRGCDIVARLKTCGSDMMFGFDMVVRLTLFGSNKELSGDLKINSLG
jgi:hypothetical protein